MSIPVATILDETASLLLDAAHRTWSAADLLGYLNEALRATAFVKPDMFTVQMIVQAVDGTVNTIPDDGVALIKVIRNENGRIITQVDEGLLDEANRFWPAGTKEEIVEHYTADPRDPRRFTVFPPNYGGGLIEILYGAVPPQIMYPEETLPVPASYQAALRFFMMAQAYSKNAKRQDMTKSSAYMAQWGQLLGLKSQSQAAIAPKVASQPGTAQ